ncbi:MAG: YbaK/EbsC family protein [Eubacteriales bacterium]
MSVHSVRKFLAPWGKSEDILEFEESSATVELAALRLSVEPARIAKTIAFYNTKSSSSNSDSLDSAILVIAAGDKRIDNAKFKSAFGIKSKMLSADDVLRLTGHAVGGVCPFDNPPESKVYADISIKEFDTVFPACGSSNSAIEMTISEIYQISHALGWVDVCKERLM